MNKIAFAVVFLVSATSAKADLSPGVYDVLMWVATDGVTLGGLILTVFCGIWTIRYLRALA